jgi:diguanylate cyclase (GGDEF)-like protein
MTIRKKIILFSVLALGAFLAAVYLVSRVALMKAFARLESESAQHTVLHMQSAFQNEQNSLEMVTRGYAHSDATFDFVQTRNPEYAITNGVLKVLRIDLVAIVDNADSLLLYKNVAVWSPDVDELQKIMELGKPFGGRSNAASGRVLDIGGHLLLLSYQPILPARSSALARGTLIMGRELDSNAVASLAVSLGFPVWLEPAEVISAGNVQGLAWSDGTNSARVESDSTMLNYLAIRDSSGDPCRFLVGRTGRSLYLEAKTESRYLLGLLMLAGTVYCGILFFFVDEVLVARIAALGNEVAKLTVSGDLSLRLNADGKDELSSLAKTVNSMLAGIQRTRSELLKAQDSLRFQAEHDALTGILNRRAIRDVLRRELARCRRDKSTLGVILADVDHFKKINDHHGHAAGDAVLVTVVQRIKGSLRSYDAMGRYGGEEFLIIAPNCDLSTAKKLAERIRNAIGDEPADLGDDNARVTVSMGVTLGTAESDPEFLVAQADTAMYHAKRNGRNRVEAGLDLSDREAVQSSSR